MKSAANSLNLLSKHKGETLFYSSEQNEYFTLFKENGHFLFSLTKGSITASTEDYDNLQYELKNLIARGLLEHYSRSRFNFVLEELELIIDDEERE